MKNASNIFTAIFFLALILFYGCSKSQTASPTKIPLGGRIISFAGYDWIVRSTGKATQGPGPNYFSDEKQNAWVDEKGRLHLRITKKEGIWYAAEVTLRKVFGYAKYAFEVESPMGKFDKNVVAAFFIYKSDIEEADIEFSTWGKPEDNNAQFVVQPGDRSGNKERFEWMDAQGNTSTHIIDWQEKYTTFASYQGEMKDTATNTSTRTMWQYAGTDNPRDQDARLKINLWLFKGQPPSDGKEVEMIVSDFKIID